MNANKVRNECMIVFYWPLLLRSFHLVWYGLFRDILLWN